MDSRAQEIQRQASAMHEDRFPVLSLWQTIAENFHVMRADFTRTRAQGDEFADGLLSSYPLIAHRELTGVMSSMLRRDKWFSLATGGYGDPSTAARRWMERAAEIQRRAMYERSAGFTKATKEGDGDFVAFGQAVLTVEMNKYRSGLLYRAWHLRDVAWKDDEQGQVSHVARKWRPQAVDLVKMFPKTVSAKTREVAGKTPFERIDCIHYIMPADDVSDSEFGDHEWVSTFIESSERSVLEQVGLHNKMYVIPRWQTESGSPYAHSPVTFAALPDARLIQAITSTLLEAGEKFTNPPMVAMEGQVRSDLQIYAGGVTWISSDHEGRAEDALRPLAQNSSGMPIGFGMQDGIQEQLSSAFYLNKLSLPDVRQMTAYEVSERMNEFVRQTLPLFEPMEREYNGQLCEVTFDLMMRNGQFGSPFDIPRELRGESVEFEFVSPISQAIEKGKGQLYQQAIEMLSMSAEVDPGARHEIDVRSAFRDALVGVGIPSKWIAGEKEAEEARMAERVQQIAAMAAEA